MSLDYVKRGENMHEETCNDSDGLFPMKFNADKEFNKGAELIEDKLQKRSDCNPQRKNPLLKCIHERLFPKLYLSVRDLDRAHTKRERLQHGLVHALINKLAYDYCKLSRGISVQAS